MRKKTNVVPLQESGDWEKDPKHPKWRHLDRGWTRFERDLGTPDDSWKVHFAYAKGFVEGWREATRQKSRQTEAA
jgi:hypothetical protein